MTIFIGAIIVGMILGLLGAGGSAIMVPILVYLVGHDAKISIAESMAIVGAISATGAVPFARSKQVDWQSVILFGLPAMLGTFIGAWLGGLATDAVQLTVFGIVLLLAAGFMISKAFGKNPAVDVDENFQRPPLTLLRGILIVLEGTIVGTLTGFVGVGGGFLIVPALLLLGKLSMRTAIGTSLVIIVMKSAVGFFKYQHYLAEHNLSVDWPTIGIFVAVGMIGCQIGQKLNSNLNQRTLKQAFAVFLVLVGTFVIVKEGSDLLNAEKPTPTRAAVVGLVDETDSQAAIAGFDVEPRPSRLLGFIFQFSETENMKALQTVIGSLPQLADLVKLAEKVTNLITVFPIDQSKERFGMYMLKELQSHNRYWHGTIGGGA